MKIKEIFEPGPFGKPPSERSVSELIDLGVINLDKVQGPTSHQVAAWVKKIVGATKAGHSGTLDPQVSGVLPTALNRACKIIGSLLLSGKEYVGVMHIHSDVPEEQVRHTVASFVGEITQLPPVRSAVRRVRRKRTIYEFEIIEIDGRDVLFRAKVQAGTYIRKLCHDVGLKLGTGAHMSELRRIRAGPFTEDTAFTLQDLNEAWIMYQKNGDETRLRQIIKPVEEAIDFLPKIFVKDSSVSAICHGAPLGASGISKLEDFKKGQVVAVFTLKGELIGTGKSEMDSEAAFVAKEGIVTRLNEVVLLRDTYPKMWTKKN